MSLPGSWRAEVGLLCSDPWLCPQERGGDSVPAQVRLGTLFAAGALAQGVRKEATAAVITSHLPAFFTNPQSLPGHTD